MTNTESRIANFISNNEGCAKADVLKKAFNSRERKAARYALEDMVRVEAVKVEYVGRLTSLSLTNGGEEPDRGC